MTVAASNATLALARDLMDKVLVSPEGQGFLRFYDDETGGPEASNAQARAWTVRIYQARAAMRRVQIRLANPNDLISSGLTSEATDPDVIRTSYDAIYTETSRGVGVIPVDLAGAVRHRPCTILRIAVADASKLNFSFD